MIEDLKEPERKPSEMTKSKLNDREEEFFRVMAKKISLGKEDSFRHLQDISHYYYIDGIANKYAIVKDIPTDAVYVYKVKPCQNIDDGEFVAYFTSEALESMGHIK